MKPVLFVAAAFAVAGLGWAQADCNPGGCWTVTDNTCYNESNCDDMAGASDGIAFQASCTGNYTFMCKVGDCSPEACTACIACAKLTFNSTTLPETRLCKAVVGDNNNCTNPCAPMGQTVELTAGHWYSLQVTLEHCSENPCGECDCVAKARLYGDVADCTAW